MFGIKQGFLLVFATLYAFVVSEYLKFQDVSAQSISTNVISNLRAEAKEANQLAERLRKIAATVNNEIHIGTLYNEINVKQHYCYALGNLLDKGDAVQHLRFNRVPNLLAQDGGDAHRLRVEAQSLRNFDYSVNRVLRMSPQEWITEWYLDCLGSFGISDNSILREGSFSTFYRIENDGKVLRVLGAIETGFSEKLQKAIVENPKVTTVALGSGGGYVYEALSAGRFIRAMKLHTTVWNNCYSACPLVFMAGERRSIMSPYPTLGFHQISSETGAIPLDDIAYRDIELYLRDMSVIPRLVLQEMYRAQPNEMNEIRGSDNFLCESRVATWIQRICEVSDSVPN